MFKGLVALVLAALVLAGCGGSSGGHATKSKLATWCSLALGDSRASVKAKMGDPDELFAPGSTIDGVALPAKLDALEWRVGHDVLLATFADGKAFNLQAYDGSIGPKGATDLSCKAFRA